METWHVTHSSLATWKDKRNVRIQYKPLDPSSASIPKDNTDKVDDSVTYQSLKDTKVQTVSGTDTAAGTGRGEWNWRGNGVLKMITSHWEVLGWGEEDGTGNKWVVTAFAKTMFTSAGLDVYSRDVGGLKAETLEAIKAGLAAIEDDNIKKMTTDLFEVKMDDARDS